MARTANEGRRAPKERLGLRIDADERSLIQRAAPTEGSEVAGSNTTVLADAARKALAENGELVLSELDRAIFFETLVRSRVPNRRLRTAFADHRTRVGQPPQA